MDIESLREQAQIIFSDPPTPESSALLNSLAERTKEDPDAPLTLLIAGKVLWHQTLTLIKNDAPADAVERHARNLFAHQERAIRKIGPDPAIIALIARDFADIPSLSKQGLHLLAQYGPATPRAFPHYVGALKMEGRTAMIASELGRLMREGAPDPFGFVKQLQTDRLPEALAETAGEPPSVIEGARVYQRGLIDAGRKSILVCSQPKSGTIFISDTLKDKLGLLNLGISVDHWPESVVVEEYAALFAKGGAVCVDHIDPSAGNLDTLRKVGIERAWVHVRDPRQGAVSWFHHIPNNLSKMRYFYRHFENPPIPDGYDDWPEVQRKDWVISSYFTHAGRWIAAWWDTRHGADGFSVSFSQQERMRDDPVAMINDILAFFGDDARVKAGDVALPEAGRKHFRKGETDEWRTFFDDEQQDRMWRLMSERPDIPEHFGWTR